MHTQQTGPAPPLPGNLARRRHQLLSVQWFFIFFTEHSSKAVNCSHKWWADRAFPKATWLFSNSKIQTLLNVLHLAYCTHYWLSDVSRNPRQRQRTPRAFLFSWILVYIQWRPPRHVFAPCFQPSTSQSLTDIFGHPYVCCRQVLLAVKMSVNQTRQILGLAQVKHKFCVSIRHLAQSPPEPSQMLLQQSCWFDVFVLSFLFWT